MQKDLFHKLKTKASRLTYGSVIYNWSLGGSGEGSRIAFTPADPWAGDAERGRWLCAGAFAIGQEQLALYGNEWEPIGVDAAWLEHMHGFSWLRDLRALGGDAGRRQARAMVFNWIENYGRWNETTWRADLTGERLYSWIALYDFFGASADEDFQADFAESVIRQARHLSRVLPGSFHGLKLLKGIQGLAYAGLMLEGREEWLGQALDLLEDEVKRQILSDGGHVSRSPAHLTCALRLLIDMRISLLAARYPVPDFVQHAIDRAACALRFFRANDKLIFVMNGAQEGDEAQLDALLAQCGGKGKVMRSLPHTGYERLTLGRSVLMVDAGAPPQWPHDDQAHAAPGAFEFHYGKERIFVSCGAHPANGEWRDVLRGTAAHNALTIDFRNVYDIREDGHFGRKAHHFTCRREDGPDASLFEGTHDGYVALNGISHARRLYLGNHGHDLRGEENLTCTVGLSKPVDVAIRFHLHPRVPVSLVQEGGAALLRLQNGTGWRFHHTGGKLAIEDSVYLGQGTRPRKTKQLVIYGRMDTDEACIKWALQRENG